MADLEDLHVLRAAEAVADGIWEQVSQWGPFEKDTVGRQLARAADSIGANIAEAFGRFHYGEKLRFLYFARGSLFETKYWLNRALTRGLLVQAISDDYAGQLTDLARQLNAFANSLKAQRNGKQVMSKTLRETEASYSSGAAVQLFGDAQLEWLQSIPGRSEQEISNP